MKIFDITGDSFTDEIENYDGTVLIDFFAEWCKPCKMMSPVIEDIAVNAGDDIRSMSTQKKLWRNASAL